jgi:Winged helix-turn-helix DNA-binding
MARRTFTDRDVARILIQWHAGQSTTEVARSLGVDPKTVRRYVAPAVEAGIVPGGRALGMKAWQAKVREWFPQLADPRLRQPAGKRISRHHERIEELLDRMPVSDIHRHLSDEVGLDASLASLRRYVRANFRAA